VKSNALPSSDQVGAPDRIGEGAQRGVVEAARTFHDRGRHLQRRLDPLQQIAPRAIGKRRAGKHERSLCGADDAEDDVRGRIVQLHGRSVEFIGRGPADIAIGDRGIQQVRRQAQMHRTWAPGARDPDRHQRSCCVGVAGATRDHPIPGSPVGRPEASAICTAAASCRECTRRCRVSIATSNSDMM
jgi:hypothetical protein